MDIDISIKLLSNRLFIFLPFKLTLTLLLDFVWGCTDIDAHRINIAPPRHRHWTPALTS